MGSKILAEHGVVCRLPGEKFGYFGWPSIARMDDGTLVVASSGLRTAHVCPFGKTVLHFSSDEGRTWSPSRVINDSPLDDRDAGVVCLGGRSLLVTWFTIDLRKYYPHQKEHLSPEQRALWEEIMGRWTDDLVNRWLGSWVLLSPDGETWSEPIRVPVSTPHGPIRRSRGDLLYLGKARFSEGDQYSGGIMACRSADGGRTWTELGVVPLHEGTQIGNYHEPHVVELTDGRLVGMIRFQYVDDKDPSKHLINFSLFQTESSDGGVTWTPARPTGIYGSPPHLLRHSSGPLVCVYGYRRPPFGQRVAISRDQGKTWESDLVLRDDGVSWDLGYPASVEMPDGSVLTIYYQKAQGGEPCSLLSSRWRMP